MPYLIYAPDPTFTGICSGVEFRNGVGVCDSGFTIGWLCAKGFSVNPDIFNNIKKNELPHIPESFDGMKIGELVDLAKAYNVSLSGIRCGDRDGIINAINKAVKHDDVS